jgi:hypothetical protein
MNAGSPKEQGRAAAEQLHGKLAKAGLLDGLQARILQTMPAAVREAHADDFRLLPMFGNTVGQYSLCFASACLAHGAAERYTTRILGIPVRADKESWHQFTTGVVEYATEVMKHPATGEDIIDDIDDLDGAQTRFCGNYPPEATRVLMDAGSQIRRVVAEVLHSLGK